MVLLTNPINIFPNGQDIFEGIFSIKFFLPQSLDHSVKIQKAYVINKRPGCQFIVCKLIGSADLNRVLEVVETLLQILYELLYKTMRWHIDI